MMRIFSPYFCKRPVSMIYSRQCIVRRKAHQRGVALFVVLVLVMLSMLLALWASRSALFNQMVISNDADYQRAFAAAQAMLQDAELDMLRVKPNGDLCTKIPGKPKICRASGVLYPPQGSEEVGPLIATLSGIDDTQCKDGLCAKRGTDPDHRGQDFWNNADLMKEMQKEGVGARYGEYTGAVHGTNTAELNATSSAILNQTGNGSVGAWYWIEVLPYSDAAESGSLVVGSPSNLLPLSANPLVVYRVTAIAYGRKQGTRVVLQQTFVPQKLKN